MNEQINGILDIIIEKFIFGEGDDIPTWDTCYSIAEAIYNAGYRKQSEGEWVEHIEKPKWLEDDVEVFYECSVCETQSPAPTKFCPNCGAKMKGADNE